MWEWITVEMNGFPRALNARNDFVNNGNCVTQFVYGFCFLWQLFKTRVTLTTVTAKMIQRIFYFIYPAHYTWQMSWGQSLYWMLMIEAIKFFIQYRTFPHLFRLLWTFISKASQQSYKNDRAFKNICLTFSKISWKLIQKYPG